jgi:enoyl-[acyl-carrier protein] reductase II
LGAEGVQIGSRFVASVESSAHPNFKQAVINAKEGDTVLTLKKLTPVRLIKNKFALTALEYENRGASVEELQQLLGRARAKKGMFEGDIEEGELEIGQVSAIIDDIKPAAQIIREFIDEYNQVIQKMCQLKIEE